MAGTAKEQRGAAPPQGQLVGTVDEYGTVWSGAPGAPGSVRIGDLVQREGSEEADLYLDGTPVGQVHSNTRAIRALAAWLYPHHLGAHDVRSIDDILDGRR